MIDFNIKRLTLDEKIGQLMICGFDATELNDHVIDLIKTYKVGNIILFARNIESPKQLFELNRNLQKLARESIGIPLFISIDQEGGMVTRIKQGATYFPGAMTISATDDVSLAYETGKLMGEELRALGINLNLAPSLDVNNNPKNPVIGVRSFGDDPERVATYGLAYIQGLQENCIATAKHFPGHGDTNVDSHLDLPKIEKSFEELKRVELVPFVKAIEGGVKAIMSSHINFPGLTENGYPTTLSKRCLTDLLRKELKFSGLIMTDCLEMKAIQTYFTTKKGVAMAISAGADLAMVSHTKEIQIEAISYLKQEILHHNIPISLIDDRVERILQAKRDSIAWQEHRSYTQVKDIVENNAHKEFALNVVRKALTQVIGTVPDPNKKTLVIASNPIQTTIADESSGSFSILKMIQAHHPKWDTLEVSIKPTIEEIQRCAVTCQNYDQVVFCSYNANIYFNQINLIQSLQEISELYVVAMRNPYDSIFFPEIKNLALLYEYTPNSIQVLMEYLKGQTLPQGRCPVNLA